MRLEGPNHRGILDHVTDFVLFPKSKGKNLGRWWGRGVTQRGWSSNLPYQTITMAAALTMNWRATQEDPKRPVGRLLLTREGSCVD